MEGKTGWINRLENIEKYMKKGLKVDFLSIIISHVIWIKICKQERGRKRGREMCADKYDRRESG